MFNTRRLKLPPTCCMKNTVNKYSSEQIDVCKGVLHECVSVLSNLSPWSTEQFVLSRLIYKMNCQFRNNKSLQMLKRVQVCVSRYCEMKILQHVKELKELLKSDSISSIEVFLPSRQMLESLLVQMMGAAALLTQTARYCLNAYEYLKANLEIGYFIPQNMLFLSVICRIWALCRSTCLYYVSWYNQLYDMLDHLEAAKVPWLTEDILLPSDLNKWIKQENSDFEDLKMGSSSVPAEEEIQSRFPLSSCVNGEFLNDRDNKEMEDDSEDVGCPISRTGEDVEKSELHFPSNSDIEMNISKEDKTDHASFLQLYSDKISACNSLKHLKKLPKSILKQNLNDEQKLKVQHCTAKLKKFKIKETELKKRGKNTRKYIDMGRNCVNLLLNSLDKERTEKQETTNRNALNFENEVSFLDFLRATSKENIKRMIKELKEKNHMTHNSKLYRPIENGVINKLCIKLKKVSKLKHEDEKETVLRKIDTLLKMC